MAKPGYEAFFEWLLQEFPGRVGFYRGFNNALAHRIEAGSDLFLMPSRYEPCGLNQMYSLRYGTVPVVRATGGLADSVQHFDPESGQGTGVVFHDFDANGLKWAMNTALKLLRQQKHLETPGPQRHAAGLFLERTGRQVHPTLQQTPVRAALAAIILTTIVAPRNADWETIPCLGSWPAVASRLPSHLRSARGRSGGTSLIPSELDWPSGPIVPYSTQILGTRNGFAHALLALRANRTIALACASIFAHTGDGPPVGTHPSSSYEKKWAGSTFFGLGRGGVYPPFRGV